MLTHYYTRFFIIGENKTTGSLVPFSALRISSKRQCTENSCNTALKAMTHFLKAI